MVMCNYSEKIDSILERMSALCKHVLPVNRVEMDKYLSLTWPLATEFTSGLRRAPMSDDLLSWFQTHVESEEKRLRDNLEIFKYIIDAEDTLELITGPGRIEKVCRMD